MRKSKIKNKKAKSHSKIKKFSWAGNFHLSDFGGKMGKQKKKPLAMQGANN